MDEDDEIEEVLDGVDQFDAGYEMGVSQAACLVRSRFEAIRHGGELRVGEVESLLAEIEALAG